MQIPVVSGVLSIPRCVPWLPGSTSHLPRVSPTAASILYMYMHSTCNTGTSYKGLNMCIDSVSSQPHVNLKTEQLPEMPGKGWLLSHVFLLCWPFSAKRVFGQIPLVLSMSAASFGENMNDWMQFPFVMYSKGLFFSWFLLSLSWNKMAFKTMAPLLLKPHLCLTAWVSHYFLVLMLKPV